MMFSLFDFCKTVNFDAKKLPKVHLSKTRKEARFARNALKCDLCSDVSIGLGNMFFETSFFSLEKID